MQGNLNILCLRDFVMPAPHNVNPMKFPMDVADKDGCCYG